MRDSGNSSAGPMTGGRPPQGRFSWSGEAKGRAGIGEIALTSNEYDTARRLRNDYWLYVVFNCTSTPELHIIQDPARLGWVPLTKIDQYRLEPDKILRVPNGETPRTPGGTARV